VSFRSFAERWFIPLAIGFVLGSLFTIAFSDFPQWTIVGDAVYVDDSNVYISATPHTLADSGWVYFNFTSKKYEGDVDAVWGFDTETVKPKKAEIFNPHWVNWTTNHQTTVYYVTDAVDTNEPCEIGNEYNTYHKKVTYSYQVDNSTWESRSLVACFDSYEADGNNYTAFWKTRHAEYKLWSVLEGFEHLKYNFGGMTDWWYLAGATVQANQNYQIRVYVDVLPRLGPHTGKYWFAIKPSTETISEAVANGHLYALDPWWNSSWSYRKAIEVNTSTNVTDYQLKLTLDTQTLISAGKMNSSCKDIRFVDENDVSMEYWLESGCNTANTVLWVKSDFTTINGTQLYIYYGNPTVNSQSSISSTYSFYDTFSSLTNWDDKSHNSGSSAQVTYDSKSCVRLSQTTNYGWGAIASKSKLSSGSYYIMTFSAKIGVSTSEYRNGLFGFADKNTATSNTINIGVFFDNWVGMTGSMLEAATNKVKNFVATSDTTTASSQLSTTLNSWKEYEIQWSNSNSTLLVEGSKLNTITTNVPSSSTSMYIVFYYLGTGALGSSSSYIDWVRIRKFMMPAPTYSFGAEETDSSDWITVTPLTSDGQHYSTNNPTFNFSVAGNSDRYVCFLLINNSKSGRPDMGDLCQQETLNESVWCGPSSSGSYTISSDYTSPKNAYDEDWDSYTVTNSSDDYLFFNYTKPNGALPSSRWQFKLLGSSTLGSGFENITMSSYMDCWNFNADYLVWRVNAWNTSTGGGGSISCQTQGGWENLWSFSGGSSAYAYFYEESMYWNLSGFVNNDTTSFVTSETSLGKGYYSWAVNCSSPTSSNVSVVRHFNIDTRVGNITSWGLNDTYINFNQSILVTVNASHVGVLNMTLQTATSTSNISLHWNGTHYTYILSNADLGTSATKVNITDLYLDGGNFTLTHSNLHDFSWCFQESANSSSTCGGKASGEYSATGDWFPSETPLFDGDWSTYAQGYDANLFVNYTKPPSAIGTSVVQVKGTSQTNFSLSSCWNAFSDKIVLDFDAKGSEFGTLYVKCHNGTSWITLGSLSGGLLYEEGVFWRIDDGYGLSFSYATTNELKTMVLPTETYNSESDYVRFYADYSTTEGTTISENCTVEIGMTVYDMTLYSGLQYVAIPVYAWSGDEYTYIVNCTNVNYAEQSDTGSFIVRQGTSTNPTPQPPPAEPTPPPVSPYTGVGGGGETPIKVQDKIVVVNTMDGVCSKYETYDQTLANETLVFSPMDCKPPLNQGKVAKLEVAFVATTGLAAFYLNRQKRRKKKKQPEYHSP